MDCGLVRQHHIFEMFHISPLFRCLGSLEFKKLLDMGPNSAQTPWQTMHLARITKSSETKYDRCLSIVHFTPFLAGSFCSYRGEGFDSKRDVYATRLSELPIVLNLFLVRYADLHASHPREVVTTNRNF